LLLLLLWLLRLLLLLLLLRLLPLLHLLVVRLLCDVVHSSSRAARGAVSLGVGSTDVTQHFLSRGGHHDW
jgi:hypothetical protein